MTPTIKRPFSKIRHYMRFVKVTLPRVIAYAVLVTVGPNSLISTGTFVSERLKIPISRLHVSSGLLLSASAFNQRVDDEFTVRLQAGEPGVDGTSTENGRKSDGRRWWCVGRAARNVWAQPTVISCASCTGVDSLSPAICHRRVYHGRPFLSARSSPSPAALSPRPFHPSLFSVPSLPRPAVSAKICITNMRQPECMYVNMTCLSLSLPRALSFSLPLCLCSTSSRATALRFSPRYDNNADVPESAVM